MAVEYCLLLNNNKLINFGQTQPSTISAMPNFTASLTTGICLLVIFSPVMPEYQLYLMKTLRQYYALGWMVRVQRHFAHTTSGNIVPDGV